MREGADIDDLNNARNMPMISRRLDFGVEDDLDSIVRPPHA